MENILICGIARTGTTSLLQSLSKDKEIIHEPFNYPLPRFQKKKLKYPSDFWDLKNTVVKSIYYQKPQESKLDNFLFYVEFSKYFDKIILLDRKNFQEHLLSCINLQAKIRNKVLYNEEKGKYKFAYVKKFSHDSPWREEDLSDYDFEYAKEYKFEYHLKRDKEDLKKISDILKVPITYYEDLFGKDRSKSLQIIKNWNIDVDSNYLHDFLHPKFKYKKTKRNLI